jgi:hypothetical protein
MNVHVPILFLVHKSVLVNYLLRYDTECKLHEFWLVEDGVEMIFFT